jgi:crotonobetainyl-CoA:carnitine CoA-transferase CaiB-like acyl-CoA transferase
MARYGLAYDDLRQENPRLIYCSITGFGQTGPYAPRPGYDYLAQGMGGIMSITGPVEGPPMKVGVAVADVVCGLYASSAILAALHHRAQTGRGQYIDLGLLDTQVSWLVNVGLNYLTSGAVPQRLGNDHPSIVPYTVLPCADGHFILAVGNDAQYQRFCAVAGAPELATDARFATNGQRVRNRAALDALLPELTRNKTQAQWVEALTKAGVPCGPVNTIDQVFADPQVHARGMRITMPHSLSGKGTVDLIGNPMKLSDSPVDYRRPPPMLGEHTDEVLRELLDVPTAEIEALRKAGVI